MKKRGIIAYSILFILCIGFISAGVSVKNNTVITQYAPGGRISGSINLSLTDIPHNAYIKTSFGDNISLMTLLRLQPQFNFSCTTSSCNSTYSATGTTGLSKSASLSAGQSQTYGFIIQGPGTVTSVPAGSFSWNITTDAPSAYVPQLTIDLLSDGSPEWISHRPTGTFGGKNYGCYIEGDAFQMATVNAGGYCEKVTLPLSPQISVGANLTKESGSATMQLSVQDTGLTSQAATCTVAVSDNGEISCIPTNPDGSDYAIKQSGDYFICIKQTEGTGIYKVRAQHITSGTKCGFAGSPPKTYVADYEVFASSGRFEILGSFFINNSETSKSWYKVSNLESRIAGYLSEQYGNNCANKCVVPIRLLSGLSQNVDLTDFRLKVVMGAGELDFNTISDIQITPSLVSSNGYQLLSLNVANFTVPDSFGNQTLEITLENGTFSYALLSKKIIVQKIPQVVAVTPTTTAAVLPTEFTANVNTFGSDAAILQYIWDFGDTNPTQTTTAKTASHVYNQLGTFPLRVTILNSEGLSSTGEFTISVVSPSEAVKEKLNESLESLESIEDKLADYPNFSQSAVKSILNLDAIRTKLQQLQASSSTASTDEQYMSIMRELIDINLPENVEETSSEVSAPFIPIGESINLDVIKAVAGGNYDSEKRADYINAIVSWGLSNVQATVDYNEFSGVYGESVAPIANIIQLNILGVSGDAYLMIPALEGIQLEQAYSQSGGYYSVPLTGSLQIIRFATSETISPLNLPVFISPSLDELDVSGGVVGGNNRMLIFGIVMGSVAVIGLLSYILVGRWYQKKYEAYLFKDRNDLYNIINYVHRLKSKGVKEGEIEKSLRKAKWSSEQISYVIKKYARKRVGIPGFTK